MGRARCGPRNRGCRDGDHAPGERSNLAVPSLNHLIGPETPPNVSAGGYSGQARELVEHQRAGHRDVERRARADHRDLDGAVEIPMIGTGTSLNVAVAGSLVLYKLAGLS